MWAEVVAEGAGRFTPPEEVTILLVADCWCDEALLVLTALPVPEEESPPPRTLLELIVELLPVFELTGEDCFLICTAGTAAAPACEVELVELLALLADVLDGTDADEKGSFFIDIINKDFCGFGGVDPCRCKWEITIVYRIHKYIILIKQTDFLYFQAVNWTKLTLNKKLGLKT